MQEIAEIDWGVLLPIVISLVSLLILGAAYQNSRGSEKTRRKEKMATAMAECYSILEEITRMHPQGALEPHSGRVWIYRDDEVDEISKKADELNKLSWSCKEYGESIRDAASVLKTLVSNPYEELDKKLLSSKIEHLAKIKDGIFEHLNRI